MSVASLKQVVDSERRGGVGIEEEVKLLEYTGVKSQRRHRRRGLSIEKVRNSIDEIEVICSKPIPYIPDLRKLEVVDIANHCSTRGHVVEIGAIHCDVSVLRRNLDHIGERVEKVTKLRILNEKRLGSLQSKHS